MTPWPPAWASTLARLPRGAKGLPHSADVGHQAIGAEQQRTVRRTAPDALDQAPAQRHVTWLADRTAQPPARLDHHGQRHPHDAALFLDAELISLPLSQVPWSFDQSLLHRLP